MTLKPLVIYVAGPLSGNVILNTRKACEVGARLKVRGYVPIVPHCMITMELATGDSDYDGWLAWCLRVLERCDAVVRMPGESKGADVEVYHATIRGIPVMTEEELLKISGAGLGDGSTGNRPRSHDVVQVHDVLVPE